MEATLSDARKMLAFQISQEGSQQDPTRDWYRAEDRIIRDHAYYRSLESANAGIDDWKNWVLARQFIQWRESVESILPNCFVPGISRPYLSLAASHDCPAFYSRLDAICNFKPEQSTAVLVAVLDGGPEAARSGQDDDHGEGLSWKKILSRDARFYEYCRYTLAMNRAAIVEGGALRDGQHVVAGDRAFQDGCLGCFAPRPDDRKRAAQNFAADAINAALHLRRFVNSLNYSPEIDWRDELHPRMVVASTWKTALHGLLIAHRDEIVVEDTLFSPLDIVAKRYLLADGIRLTGSH